MSSDEWQRIKEVFNCALELDSASRLNYLDTACAGDAALRRNVEDLLAAYQTDFLEDNLTGSSKVNSAADRLLPGQQISHYKIIRRLGAGGMGEVYLALDLVLHRDVAIKVITATGVGSEEAKQRLIREARAAAALDHQNICLIYEVGESDGSAFIAMQYIDGQTLAERSNTPISVDETLRLGIQIAEALAAAHARGIIHRDIKPENVMLTSGGHAKVMDFGIAKVAESATITSEDETRVQFTQPGMILGTPTYMSPEQAKGEKLDARSDIFSLGAVLYEMVSGRRPFDAASTAEVLVAILTREPEPLSNNVPIGLRKVVSKMLHKDRNDRFSSMSEVVAELRRCRDGLEYVSDTAQQTFSKIDPKARHASIPVIAALIVVAALVGFIYTYFFRSTDSKALPQITSLAVLPLQNLSGDPSHEYFADGMTEALISNLSQIKGLKVISRTSIMRYKDSHEPLPEIAKTLGVDAVIEGSVLKAGDRVRVTAQLIHATSDAHLWSRNYERDLSDILRLQSEVAQAIAREVRVQLTPAEQNRLASSGRTDPKAHEAYLLGKFHLSRNSEEDVLRAISYFQKAIDIEPDHADAYAGLATAWLQRGIWGGGNLSDFESHVRDAATTAIRIDPGNASAHIAMSQLLNNYDYDWRGAEEEITRALEIDPNNPDALEAYSWVLQSLGRHAEVRPLMERAEQLDPVSSRIQSSFGRMLYRARRYEEAETHLKRSIELDPTNYGSYGRLADVYIEMGRFDEALAQLEKSSAIQPGGAHAARQAVTYARMGDRKKALDTMNGMPSPPQWELARLYTALGDVNKALEVLNGAAQRRDTLLVHVKEDPSFVPLHSDPRWESLLRELNFPGV